MLLLILLIGITLVLRYFRVLVSCIWKVRWTVRSAVQLSIDVAFMVIVTSTTKARRCMAKALGAKAKTKNVGLKAKASECLT